MQTEPMEDCVNHPDTPGTLACMKYQLYFCERCARCRDPKLYCKHRPACIIWFMAKDREKHAAVGVRGRGGVA